MPPLGGGAIGSQFFPMNKKIQMQMIDCRASLGRKNLLICTF